MGTTLGPRPPWDESREPILRAPRIVTSFIVICLVVHAASLFLSTEQYEWVIVSFALIPRLIAELNWGFNGETSLTLASFVTYAFLHGGFAHLLLNSVGFLIFGTPVARRIGTGRFVVLSLITTIAAALTHLIVHWGSPEPVIGASGVVSGLMGAAFRFIFIDPKTTPVYPPARLPLFSRPVLQASAVIIVLNVVLGVAGFTPEGFGFAIAWEAHIGGFLAGLLLFPLFDRQRRWIS